MVLGAMVTRRQQNAMNEFFGYCKFDEKCHHTLKSFISIMDKLGRYKMRHGLLQWHQKCFKTLENLD